MTLRDKAFKTAVLPQVVVTLPGVAGRLRPNDAVQVSPRHNELNMQLQVVEHDSAVNRQLKRGRGFVTRVS